MTIVVRRLIYSFAFLVFFIVAPLVVALTLGYRWTGWSSGFIRTGILVVTSQPKAELFIDGRDRGSSPRRVAGLAPGVHRVRLERPGYTPWEQLIQLDPNTARVIGPVKLFPLHFGITEIQSGLHRIVVDRDQTVIVDVQATNQTWQVRQVWPPNQNVEIDLPDEPDSLIRSPRGQVWIFPVGAQTEIRLPAKPNLPWTIPTATQLAWTAASDHVFFGLRDGLLVRFDGLTRTETILGPATSLGLTGETVWFTRKNAGTELWRQPALGQGLAIRVATTVGNWEIKAGGANQLWWRNRDNREAEFLSFNALTTAFGREPFGHVDQMFWSDGQPPVWVDGVGLMGWVNDRAVLLERSPNEYQFIRWLDPPHLLVSVEPNQAAIKSVSLRQGHQTILSTPLKRQQSVVWLEPQQSRLIVFDDRGKKTLWLYRWDQTTAD